jgi:hypothetical protein
MDTIKHLLRRDDGLDGRENEFGASMGSLVLVFFGLLIMASALSISLLYLRRRRLARQQTLLPTYQHTHHNRSASTTNLPTFGHNDSVFVYDEKMNLIANSSSPPSSGVPEIRVTFPDEEGNSGQRQHGRVVVVHVTDTGSIGMSPLNQEQLPPYQRSDADRFQSLDLERMGGLREKESAPLIQQRWS